MARNAIHDHWHRSTDELVPQEISFKHVEIESKMNPSTQLSRRFIWQSLMQAWEAI